MQITSFAEQLLISDEDEIHHSEPEFDFDKPESVIFQVDGTGPWKVTDVCIMDDPNDTRPHVLGAMSYDNDYGSFIDYTVDGMIPKNIPFGFYVLEDVTGFYSHGDRSWGEDDDMDFYPGRLRPARYYEVRPYLGGKSRLVDLLICLKTHLQCLWRNTDDW